MGLLMVVVSMIWTLWSLPSCAAIGCVTASGGSNHVAQHAEHPVAQRAELRVGVPSLSPKLTSD